MIRFPNEMLFNPVAIDASDDNILGLPKKQDKDFPRVAVPIDQYDSEDFNQNDFGFPRNDISALARASSQQEYDLIMKRIQISAAKGDVPQGVKPVDAIRRVRSRYCQSPNELLDFASRLAEGDMKKLDDAYNKAVQDVQVTKNKAVQDVQVTKPVDNVDSSVDTSVESK